MNKFELKEKLELIVKNIIEKKDEYRILSMDRNRIKNELNEHTNGIKLKISEELDDKGKPLYSNETKRTARFNEVVSLDSYYNETVDTIEEMTNNMDKLLIDIEKLKYEFQIEDILSKYPE